MSKKIKDYAVKFIFIIYTYFILELQRRLYAEKTLNFRAVFSGIKNQHYYFLLRCDNLYYSVENLSNTKDGFLKTYMGRNSNIKSWLGQWP